MMRRNEDDESVIDQADALMRRYRSFVARSTEGTEAADTESGNADVDIPVLTEVVDQASMPQGVDEVLAALHAELEAVLSEWLVDALPAAVTNASQHVLAELDAKARGTLLPRLQEIVAAHGARPEEGQSL
jgi:hypothetical protein